MNNKIIQFITSDARFAFVFSLCFIIVVAKAFLEGANSRWADSAWFMLSILGIIVSITAIVSFSEALESNKWPQLNANLISTSITSSSSRGGSVLYTPEVKYEYSYLNTVYEGNVIDYSAFSGSERRAQKIIKKIEKDGRFLQVHINPANPSTSVIYPGLRLVHLLRFIIGPAMCICGIIFGLNIVEIK